MRKLRLSPGVWWDEASAPGLPDVPGFALFLCTILHSYWYEDVQDRKYEILQLPV